MSNEQRVNLYVEFRQWVFFWGLFLDSEKATQSLLEEYNSQGWSCIHFQLSIFPKLTIGRIILLVLVFICTLGFIQFWVGGTFLFERPKYATASSSPLSAPKSEVDLANKIANAQQGERDQDLDNLLARLGTK
jgi:hypothetical protein